MPHLSAVVLNKTMRTAEVPEVSNYHNVIHRTENLFVDPCTAAFNH